MKNHRDNPFEQLQRQQGSILIVTIWVVLVLAGLALVFARSTRVAALGSANQVAALEAESIAGGALEYVRAKLVAAATEDTTTTDTSESYLGQQVGTGYFWVLRSNLENDREFDYGVTDEAAKINLNSASLEMLLKLPGMTSELAASIIDWRDTDSDVTAGGAEDEYYLLQPEPYHCKNALLETVDELLLIKGGTRELLYGEDTNLNGILDDCENDGDTSEPDDNRNGRLDAGFYDYVTVYSVEANTDSEGNTRINVASASGRKELQTALQDATSEDRALEIMNRLSTGASYTSIIDFYYRSGMTYDEFTLVADRLTTSSETTLTGLVNVNTAPKEVLLCLPGLEESDAEALLTYRSANQALDSVAWVTKALTQEKATGMGAYITTRSHQYSADIIGVSGNGRAYRRYKAVLDTRQTPPRVVYWKVLTDSGWPLHREIVATLRKGEPLTKTILNAK